MGTFPDRTTGRKKTGADYLCAIWLDLDSHGGGKYDNPNEALEDLLAFVKHYTMPLPYINMSGHGIQAFWCSQQRLTQEDWLKNAEMLRAIAEDFGLDIDGEVTTDAARVMRIPLSMNFRDPQNPVQGHFIGENNHE